MGDSPEAQQPAFSEKLYGSVHIVPAKEKHKLTAIFLHGRGSSGKEFSCDLLTSSLTNGQSLQESLQSCRWVFPTSRRLWSTAFQEILPAWFEAHSLSDITALQHLQVEGLFESVNYILRVVEREVVLLNGEWKRVVLGGISQGAAVGLWALFGSLRWPGKILGGFVGLSTWLPFADNVERILTSEHGRASNEMSTSKDKMDEFAKSMMPPYGLILSQRHWTHPQIFLGHGMDDAYVDVELGKQAARVLAKFGMVVEWREYSGAGEEGHWLKEPEELDDVHRFLKKLIYHNSQNQ